MDRRLRKSRNRGVSRKAFALVLAMVLVVSFGICGTIAWLVADTNPVVNSFTYGDINITLEETKAGPFNIVPGCDIEKDPKVTVEADSEDCIVFVKVKEENWPGFTDGTTRKVSYALAEGWTRLESVDGVYYRTVNKADSDQAFDVLADNKVVVSGDLTREEIGTAPAGPKLTFTAYAVQLHKNATENFTPAEAWEKVNAE